MSIVLRYIRDMTEKTSKKKISPNKSSAKKTPRKTTRSPKLLSETPAIPLEEVRILQASIRNVDARIDRYARPGRVFLRGVIHGFGSVIGGTIVAGIIIGILVQVVSTAEQIPWLDNVIQRFQVDETNPYESPIRQQIIGQDNQMPVNLNRDQSSAPSTSSNSSPSVGDSSIPEV
jgi:hypothetical protein